MLGHSQTSGIHAMRKSQAMYKILLRGGEAELRILEITPVFHHLSRVGPKQLVVCVSAVSCVR